LYCASEPMPNFDGTLDWVYITLISSLSNYLYLHFSTVFLKPEILFLWFHPPWQDMVKRSGLGILPSRSSPSSSYPSYLLLSSLLPYIFSSPTRRALKFTSPGFFGYHCIPKMLRANWRRRGDSLSYVRVLLLLSQ
jgi:hypothetical protein